MTHKVVVDELVSTQMMDLFSIFLRKEILVNKVRGKKIKTLFKGQEISENIFYLAFNFSKKAIENKNVITSVLASNMGQIKK